MAVLKFSGPFGHRVRSSWVLNRIAMSVFARHALGKKIAPDWDAQMEIGIRFWRHQFTTAMNHKDIAIGRSIYDSLHTRTDDIYSVLEKETGEPAGTWFEPHTRKTDKTVVYFHGGGYAFAGPNSHRYAAMLAHHIGARLFMPRYRLTPEHAHPAQSEDAMAAWQYVCRDHEPHELVLVGDSAGGHMALMLLQELSKRDLGQPSLCIALCPWVDIGRRGASMANNDHYDLVQGWMALKFGEWLNPENRFTREELSPIHQDFSGLAPIYVQVGGRDIFRDPVIEFAEIQAAKHAQIMLDVWDVMPHNFQAYDSIFMSSTQALERISRLVGCWPNGLPEPLDGVTKIRIDRAAKAAP